MFRPSSSFQRDFLNTTLKTLFLLLLFRTCDTSISNIDLSTTTLDPATTGFMMTGNDTFGYLGVSVSTAGDINNDGYDDIIVGAQAEYNSRGAVYVIYGGPTTSMSNLDFRSATLDPTTTGFMITGEAAGDYLGFSVSSAGDIDNDGYDDIIVGAYGKSTKNGATYVIYGGPKSSMSNIDLSTTALDPSKTGFTITGPIYSYVGWSVSTAGDVNKDGYSDIIIGAPLQEAKKGAAYVIYGGPRSSMSNIYLQMTTLDPSTTGFIITGNALLDSFGWSVSSAGDIDNDGYDDIIVGAKALNRGKVYVIYGGPKSSMSNINLSTSVLDPLITGFMMISKLGSFSEEFGVSVSTTGDLNNDGYADIIIGANGRNNSQGAAYVIYGGSRSSLSDIDFTTTTLDPATTGFMITGNTTSDWLGKPVATARDVNHDGYSDIIVGASHWNYNKGVAYVIYGGPKSSMSNIDLSCTTLDPATTGFIITGNAAGDYFGYSVSTAGDINHDGYGDLIVGAYAKSSAQGVAYVAYGGPKPSVSKIDF